MGAMKVEMHQAADRGGKAALFGPETQLSRFAPRTGASRQPGSAGLSENRFPAAAPGTCRTLGAIAHRALGTEGSGSLL